MMGLLSLIRLEHIGGIISPMSADDGVPDPCSASSPSPTTDLVGICDTFVEDEEAILLALQDRGRVCRIGLLMMPFRPIVVHPSQVIGRAESLLVPLS